LKGDLREHQEGGAARAGGGVHALGGEASNFKLLEERAEEEEEEEEEGECEECGLFAMGAIDQSNDAFYCNACWALFKVYTCSK
jgi:hypothetical protein